MTAIDASAEMIAIARSRPECAEVAFEQADIFSWNNTTKYDVVFFSFWLSHVPPDLFEGFWNVVRDSLKPAGRAFFIDSATFELPRPDYDGVTDLRTLNNGDQYQIVKVLYGPEQLSEKLSGMGWTASISSTEGFFLYGSARPRWDEWTERLGKAEQSPLTPLWGGSTIAPSPVQPRMPERH